MRHETTVSIFQNPSTELLMRYVSHLQGAIAKATSDGKCVVMSPSGQFVDTTTRVQEIILRIQGEPVALGQQEAVPELISPALQTAMTHEVEYSI